MYTQEFSTEVDSRLDSIATEFRGIDGDYCETLLKGMWHFLCDSGIKDDSFSRADRIYLDEHAALYADEDSSFYDIDTYYDIINNAEHLDCNRLLTKIYELADATGHSVETLARELRYRE